MNKITVANPIVELDGDEMTRIIWDFIKNKLILPYLEIDLKYYDLGIESRDATEDRITVDAANAIRQHGVGVKCATITPDEARVEEFGLKKMWRSPQRHDPQHPRRHGLPRADHLQKRAAAGAGLDPADRHRPSRLRRPVPRHRFPHPRRRQADITFDAARTAASRSSRGLRVSRAAAWRWPCTISTTRSAALPGPASTMACSRNWPVYLSTKNTILKAYDGRFKDLFQEVFDAEFKDRFQSAGLTYEHRLIDDMVAAALKWEGGFVWAAKNYDGDVQSDTVAQGFGSLGLMTSVLMTPAGDVVEAEAAHGTVTRHYRQHQKGQETSTNPIASIFAWTRGLSYRAKFDDTTGRRGIRRDAGTGLRGDGRGRLHDQGSGDPDRAGTALADYQPVPRQA